MPNTGYKAYTNLEQYYLDNSEATGVTKSNTIGDPDYIGPFIDLEFCPLPSVTPTPTPSVTPSTTVTPSITPSITVTPSTSPPAASVSTTPSITPSRTVTPSITPSVTVTPSITPSTGFKPTVGDVTVSLYNCGDGPASYLGWNLTLLQPAVVDVNYTIQVTLGDNFTSNTVTYGLDGVIPAGLTYDDLHGDPCLPGHSGAFIGTGYVIQSFCISSIDNTVINPLGTC